MSTPRLARFLAATLTLSAASSASDGPTFERRLELLGERLDAARVEAHVPGMSIAIVRGDDVVWARGFGLADLAEERPADEHTIYAIGSSTKAFTATLVGMLVDEGRARWDDPVTRYLPTFDLAVRSEDADAECTLRDLLSHRHGFSRMGILWAGGDVSRELVLRTAAGAEPWDDFRAGFHYCNVTYLAAGVAAGVAGGSTWDELLVERLFEPLGMTSSTLSVSEVRDDPRLALGYGWDETDEMLVREEMVSLDNVGPSGSINSNVLDMAQWLRLLLGEGVVDGARLVSAERLHETWAPQVEIAGGVSYGLGWMLREHDGRRVVEHGGNIDGFSAEVAFLPDEGLGYVLLMNRSVSPLREPSIGIVFDALLDGLHDGGPQASAAAAATPGPLDFEDYTGTYLANFATFRDEEFEVLVQGDRLALDVPSQRTFELEPPDADGLWSFSLTDQIAVSFERDEQDTVVALTMHQSEYHFEVPRVGFERPPEVPAEELEKYAGTYVRAKGGKRVELSVQRGRLTMLDKGKLLAFETPDAEGHAPLRARADHGATFRVDAEGTVESFVFHGEAGDRLFTRLAGAADLPTVDEVLALRDSDTRVAAVDAAGGRRITGEAWVAQAGVRGTMTMLTQGRDRYAHRMDFGPFGRIETVARGGRAWTYTSMRGFDELKGDRLTQALLEHPGAVQGDWTDTFDSVEVVREDSVEDRAVYVVRLEKGDLPSRTYWVDAENGDLLRSHQVSIEGPLRLPVTIAYSEFEEIDGVRTPMRIEVANPESGRTVLTFQEVESGLELGDEVFTLEDPDEDPDEDPVTGDG